jgi:RNA polymerase sigma-70 factor (ECF subfamily)
MTDTPCTDTYEQFVRLFVAQEGRLRVLLRTLVPSLDDLDEVMQETSLAAWRKFSQFEPGTDFLAWTATIGRFEALRRRRERAAERLVFSDELCDLLAQEAIADTEILEAQRRALDACLGKLPEQKRQWLAAAYQPGANFREVAQQSGKTVEAFYKMLQRLREILADCIQREIQQNDTGLVES